MDLSPFYDLRARLHAGAVAGAALAAGDFRLGRALEALAPLEGAAPVFQKLGQLTRALLAPDCPDRAGALLDALSLADAIACTQGAVAVPGEVEPLPLAHRGEALTNAPYSVLAPLLEALTTSGGGRYGFVVDAYERQPRLFGDYRVKNALVQALGASYSELADRAEEWLSAGDPSVLPLLEKDFDPRGRRGMVRRVHVIEALAGAEANGFYLSRLEGAEKEVRAALIYALRHHGGNAQRLVDLCKTEKGNCRKMAHWALAKLDSPAAWDYWEKLEAKKPGQAVEYMALSTTSQAGALVARAAGRWLEPYEADPSAPLGEEKMKAFQSLLLALPGKSGPEVCAVYRRMAALGTALDNRSYQWTNGQNRAVRFQSHEYQSGRDYLPFSQAAVHVLRRAILFHPTPDLLALPGELEGESAVSYAAPALTAALLTRSAGEAYELAAPLLKPAGLLGKKPRKDSLAILKQALDGVYWDEERRGLSYFLDYMDPATGGAVRVARPLKERPDPRWYEDLMKLGGGEETDELLDSLLCPDDPQLCARLGEHFYRRALTVDDNRAYYTRLRRCGWTDCRGLLEAFCRRRRVATWELCGLLPGLPGAPEAVADEAERVLALVRDKKIAVGAWNPTQVEREIAGLRRQAHIN